MFKKGDKVICIDDEGIEEFCIIKNKQYEVFESYFINNGTTEMIKIYDNHNNLRNYYANRFILANEDNNLSQEEQYLYDSIIAARKVQEFLWGELNSQWDLEEWKKMFQKRIVKISDIDISNPHAIVELRKRLLQNAALCIALLGLIEDKGIKKTGGLVSNLPEYNVSQNPKEIGFRKKKRND